jgi:hypothetical protein
MKKIILASLLALSLNAKMVDGVAVVVKDEPITTLDIKKQMKLSHSDAKTASEILIRKKLELLEIEQRGIGVDESDVYEEIKKRAALNNLSVDSFYAALRDANGLNSQDIKKLIKEQLLSQKLYNAIAYSSISQPTQDEIEEYYKLHKDEFSHPSAFDVIIYKTSDPKLLEQQILNPMFYSPKIEMTKRALFYNQISPQLAQLLASTKQNRFTQIVPDGTGSFMTFYIKSVKQPKQNDIESVKNEIIDKIMMEKRKIILDDYFTKLRHKTDIKILRVSNI